MAKHSIRGLLLLSVVILAGLLFLPSRVEAVSGSDFRADRIIDDVIFFNAGTMNPGDIQNFLNAKVPTCDTNGTQPSGHAGYSTRADWGTANGAPPPYTCLRNYTQGIPSVAANAYCNGIGGGTKSAADIIFNVAQACGINPQVFIVLLQKEQSLITDDWPWPIQYRSATGYGCPDTAPCDAEYYGFFNQVYNAGKQFKRYIQQPDSFNFAVGRNSFIPYQANAPQCGGTNVTILTRATAALYNYTPYQPNAAALANLYGTGDGCSAYGNRNFWRMFNDWFGNTLADGFTVAKADNSLSQYLLFGGIKQSIPDTDTKIAWNLHNAPLVEMPADYLATIPSGPTLDRLTRLNTSDQTIFFMDSGRHYRVSNQNVFNSWNFGGKAVSSVPPSIFYLSAEGGPLSYSVKNAAASAIYALDGANGSAQTVLRQYSSDTVRKAWEGESTGYTEVSSSFFSTIDNAVGAVLSSTKVSHAGSEYQVVDGSRLLQPSPYSSIFPGTAQAVSMATLNRLPSIGSVSHLVRAAGDNTVYMLDNGTKRAVANPSVLNAWTQPGGRVQLVNASYTSLITSGSALNGYSATAAGQTYIMNGSKYTVPVALEDAYQGLPTTAVTTSLVGLYPTSGTALTGFIRGANSPELYFLDNSGNKRHIESGDKATLLGAYATGVTLFPDALVGTIPSAPSLKTFVSDGVSEYVIENGTKHSVNASVKADWGLSGAQVYSDGTLSRFPNAAALTSKLKDGANYYLIKGGRGFLTTDINIANAWAITDAPQMNQVVVRNLVFYYMLTRFVRSTTDSRTFVIDQGNWYNVSAAQLTNLGGVGVPTMGLEPANAPNSITDWTSVVVKDSVGKHYVIDNGTKRSFAHPFIQDWWTNNGSLTVPTTSNGFLNLLPNNGTVERAIKGSAPAVYSAENGTKRHILSSSTYHLQYAPFQSVSDALLGALPTGSNIP